MARLTDASEGLAPRPLKSPEEVVARLGEATSYWGWYATPAEARLLSGLPAFWREVALRPYLQELRVFGPDRDAQWWEGRGVELAVVPKPTAPSPDLIGGPGWLQRDRRSRLWGEWLEGTDAWYEERIPDPLRYQGLEPGAQNRYAFLRYREYIQGGVVRYVRYLGVEGGTE